MSAALTFEVLAALRELHAVCASMCIGHQGKRPTEDEYIAAMEGAAVVLRKVPAQIAIADRVAFSVALRQNDLNACMAIARRHDLAGWENETVIVGLDAAARGRDINAAIEAHLNGVTES